METLSDINLVLSVILKLILLIVLVVSVIEFFRLSKAVRKFIDDLNKLKSSAEYVLNPGHLQNIVKLFVEFNAKTLLVRLIDGVLKRQTN